MKRMTELLSNLIQEYNKKKHGLHVSYSITGQMEKTIVIFLNGYLDTKNSYDLTNLLDVVIKGDSLFSTVILDCYNLTNISSTGIGAFTTALVNCNRCGITFALSRLQYKVIDTMKLLGFFKYFTILKKQEWSEGE